MASYLDKKQNNEQLIVILWNTAELRGSTCIYPMFFSKL